MDLSTTYLGFNLPHPIMPGASPLVDHLDLVKRLEDAGAAAITMHSLFEEQITREQQGMVYHMELLDRRPRRGAVATSRRPTSTASGRTSTSSRSASIKQTVKLPVIASLNGTTAEGWLEYAKLIQQAGADALELNVYHVAADPAETGAAVERRLVDIVRAVKESVTHPGRGEAVAVLLVGRPPGGPARRAGRRRAGAVQPLLPARHRSRGTRRDVPSLSLSHVVRPAAAAALARRCSTAASRPSLAVTGGVHTPARRPQGRHGRRRRRPGGVGLLKHGPEHIKGLVDGMRTWLEEHEYESLKQAMGSMSLERSPNPAAFERANYMKVLAAFQMQIG